MAMAASTEFPATARFSARMDAGLWIAGEVAMEALSPLLRSSANYRFCNIPASSPVAGTCARILLDPYLITWRNH